MFERPLSGLITLLLNGDNGPDKGENEGENANLADERCQ